MDGLWALLVFLAVAGLYILPTVYAVARQTSMRLLIGVLNLLLGWTIVRWVVALALAVLLPPPLKQGWS